MAAARTPRSPCRCSTGPPTNGGFGHTRPRVLGTASQADLPARRSAPCISLPASSFSRRGSAQRFTIMPPSTNTTNAWRRVRHASARGAGVARAHRREDRQNAAMSSTRAEVAAPVAVAGNLLIVYVLWGSTYLAIRLAVETLPPFYSAATRYLIAGVLVLIAPIRGLAAVNPFGVGLVVIAAISWASGSLYSRHAPMPRSGLLGTGMEMLAGGALLAVAGTITGEFSRTNPAQFSTTSLLAVAYLVVFGSLVAFSAYTWLLQHAPVSTVATYAYVNPIVAVGLGAFFLQEPITPRTLVASALIIGAVVAMVSGRRRDERV